MNYLKIPFNKPNTTDCCLLCQKYYDHKCKISCNEMKNDCEIEYCGDDCDEFEDGNYLIIE